MFPCGRLLCNSLDTHSGQLRAVWGQQESITINRPFRVKKRWSDDLTDDSCWLCLPEGPLHKEFCWGSSQYSYCSLQSEWGCVVLPSIWEFWTFSLNLLLCLHESIAAFLVTMSFCLRFHMRCHPAWERDVILMGRGKLRTPHPPFETFLQRNKTLPWSPHGPMVLFDVLLGN